MTNDKLNKLWGQYRKLVEEGYELSDSRGSVTDQKSGAAIIGFLEKNKDTNSHFYLDLCHIRAGARKYKTPYIPSQINLDQALIDIAAFRKIKPKKNIEEVRDDLVPYYADSLAGQVYFQQGHVRKALANFRKRNPDLKFISFNEDHYFIGVIYQQGGERLKPDPKKAIKHLGTFLNKSGSSDPENQRKRADAADRIYTIGLTHFQKALQFAFIKAINPADSPRTKSELLESFFNAVRDSKPAREKPKPAPKPAST